MDRKPLLQSSHQDYESCQSGSPSDMGDENESSNSEKKRGQGQSAGHGQIRNEGHTKGQCEDRIEDAENDPSQEEKGAARPAQAGKSVMKRMALLTLIGFLSACSIKLYTPLMTQYTYQFYTEQVYGNLSRGVDVSSHPCVNTTSFHDTSSDQTDTREKQVQDLSADFLSRASMINGGVAIVVNVFLGSYSDILGRKLVLFIPVLGYFLRSATMPVVIYWDLGINAMYVGYLLDGLLGSFPAILAGMYAYSADITPGGGERTLGLAVVEFSFGLGFAMINVLAGLFIQDVGFFYPSIVAAGLSLIAMVLIAVMPETVSRDRKRVTPLYKMPCRLVRTFLPADNVYRRALLLLTLLLVFVLCIPNMSFDAIQSLYLMNRPFCWDSFDQGLLGTATDVSSYLVSLVVIKLLKNRVASSYMVIIGLISDIGRNVILGLASNNLMIYMAMVAAIFRKMIFPALRSTLSILVPKEKQGTVFAGVAVLESVAVCASPTVFMSIYKSSLSFMAGFFFLCVAGLDAVNIITCIVTLWLWKKFQGSQSTILSVQAP